MTDNRLDWLWIEHSSDSVQETFFLSALGLGLAMGLMAAVLLWRRGGRSRVSSIAIGFVVSELPMIHVGWCMGGFAGGFGGWALGYLAFGQLTLCACLPVSVRELRAATWGQTAVVVQIEIFSLSVGYWLGAAEGFGMLSYVWAMDRLMRSGGWWDVHLSPWLDRRTAQVTAAVVTVYPLLAAGMLRTRPRGEWEAIDRHVMEAFPLHSMTFAVLLSLVAGIACRPSGLPATCPRRPAAHRSRRSGPSGSGSRRSDWHRVPWRHGDFSTRCCSSSPPQRWAFARLQLRARTTSKRGAAGRAWCCTLPRYGWICPHH